ncbi:MAG: M48 family metallopeptidase, partial [Gammaproteobacteria bacterium]|nr:M48 family metallopeptidase [Gammaproteobacteria bacterium]
MTMNTITLIFIIALVLSVAIQIWLDRRQVKYVAANRAQVPDAFAEQIPLDAHQKAADYTLTNMRLGLIELVLGTCLLLIWTLGGALDWLDNSWRSMGWSPIMTGVIVIFSMVFISGLIDLPMNIYRTFRVEQKFGFNRTTPALFITDLIKQTLLMIAIGLPLLWVILWLMGDIKNLDPFWWFYVWAVWISFSLFMMWAYPAFIAPIFNKFEPLEDMELKQRIENLLQRCGFTSKGVFIMDGSRRSAHGNAYFTGLGENKRIVFFDTLLKSLDPSEVEAVLAHELGHFKRKHIKKRIISMAVISLLSLAFLGWLMQYEDFYHGLGVSEPSTYIALVLFMMVSPLFSIYLQPIFAWVSRKHEFEADDFASEQSNANDLITAL